MAFGLLALEHAARSGADAVARVLEDLFEELRAGDGDSRRLGEAQAGLGQIVRMNLSTWLRHPEVVVADFYSRTLSFSSLDSARPRWQAELDERGPWLRALRHVPTLGGPVTSLHADGELQFSSGRPYPRCRSHFRSETCVVFEPPSSEPQASRWLWNWTDGRVENEAFERRTDASDSYPRSEWIDDAPVLRRTATSPPVSLPWPDLGHAQARLSGDGHKIYVYGWYEDYNGLLYVLDATSLEIELEYEFGSSVCDVLDRPDSEELLVQTNAEIVIVGPAPRWTLELRTESVGWSPSGRHICVVVDSVAQIWDREQPTHSRRSTGLPPSFCPDGTRLVDGTELFDGHTGAHVAMLQIELDRYLEGGPAMPWYHVGSELIVCAHSGLRLWRTSSGEPVVIGDGVGTDLQLPHWYCVAYDMSGAIRAQVHQHQHEVVLHELPSMKEITVVVFEIDADLLALSADAEMIAVVGGGRVEVRRRDGSQVFAGTDDPASNHSLWRRFQTKLCFSLDEHALILLDRNAALDEARAWRLVGEPTLQPYPAAARSFAACPPGWTIEAGPITSFVRSDGKRLAVPCDGPWSANPRTPNLLACPGGLFELRDGIHP